MSRRTIHNKTFFIVTSLYALVYSNLLAFGGLVQSSSDFARKVGITLLLCATSAFSASLWFMIAGKKQPQRTQSCTENKFSKRLFGQSQSKLHLVFFFSVPLG